MQITSMSYSQEIKFIQICPIPFQIWSQNKTFMFVRVLIDDAFFFTFLIQKIVDPLLKK